MLISSGFSHQCPDRRILVRRLGSLGSWVERAQGRYESQRDRSEFHCVQSGHAHVPCWQGAQLRYLKSLSSKMALILLTIPPSRRFSSALIIPWASRLTDQNIFYDKYMWRFNKWWVFILICRLKVQHCGFTFPYVVIFFLIVQILGFLNLFVWLGNLWFLFKETPWHSPRRDEFQSEY